MTERAASEVAAAGEVFPEETYDYGVREAVAAIVETAEPLAVVVSDAPAVVAHYLKAMMRDKIGSFMTREQCETFLNRWISHYVLLDDNAPQDLKAKFPLRDARIEVAEIPGKPGAYTAVAFLRPHFQLEELAVSLRLVARLPAAKG